jgi:hypothetical protein
MFLAVIPVEMLFEIYLQRHGFIFQLKQVFIQWLPVALLQSVIVFCPLLLL